VTRLRVAELVTNDTHIDSQLGLVERAVRAGESLSHTAPLKLGANIRYIGLRNIGAVTATDADVGSTTWLQEIALGTRELEALGDVTVRVDDRLSVRVVVI